MWVVWTWMAIPGTIGRFPPETWKDMVFVDDIQLMEEIRLTTWDIWNLVNDGINYQPQLWCRISSINTMFAYCLWIVTAVFKNMLKKIMVENPALWQCFGHKSSQNNSQETLTIRPLSRGLPTAHLLHYTTYDVNLFHCKKVEHLAITC